jgi:lactate permease
MWNQVYDPFNNTTASTIAAALPVVTLLVLIASNKVKAHVAAIVALIVANFVAILIFTLPVNMSLRATVLGALTGFFPIGWIVLNVIFLYRLTVEKGVFETLQNTIGGVTNDRRLQLLLIAFSFGAFFEGASGFGTPVAVTGAILIGLGFSPLAASGLSLVANTAPVAYGALGTPIAGLASVTELDPFLLGAMVGRQLPFFSLIVPFWLIWAFAGWRGMLQVWPAILVTGVSFAVPQFLISNFINHLSMDCRYRRIADLHGVPRAVPAGLVAEGDLDVAGVAPPRRLGPGGACAEIRRSQADAGTNVDVASPLDHRVPRPLGVGHELLQGTREPVGHLELSSA